MNGLIDRSHQPFRPNCSALTSRHWDDKNYSQQDVFSTFTKIKGITMLRRIIGFAIGMSFLSPVVAEDFCQTIIRIDNSVTEQRPMSSLAGSFISEVELSRDAKASHYRTNLLLPAVTSNDACDVSIMQFSKEFAALINVSAQATYRCEWKFDGMLEADLIRDHAGMTQGIAKCLAQSTPKINTINGLRIARIKSKACWVIEGRSSRVPSVNVSASTNLNTCP